MDRRAATTTAGSGTLAITNNATSLTFSTAQTGLSGTYLVVTGDTSNGLYLIGSGSGTAWTITTPYGGPTAAAAAWGTDTPNTAHPIALPVRRPDRHRANNLLTAVGCLTNFQSFMTGGASPPRPTRRRNSRTCSIREVAICPHNTTRSRARRRR